MNKRQRDILHLLETGGRTSSELAHLLDAPEPSIRRSIQTLRKAGWNISFAGYDGIYRMANVVMREFTFTTDRDFADESELGDF